MIISVQNSDVNLARRTHQIGIRENTGWILEETLQINKVSITETHQQNYTNNRQYFHTVK